ncbi:uncharacterized protein LOC107782416 [Nicotiana tabacum]|uniref:Uncharacterized protein LOC107782416 n=2 Tax=Nicotiana TaxID=4085 RepID=A0A1S3Z345_TOBAC|nr:uncharacterized protein LOC104114410 isoform X1 [Nicotiana tomentosiformis]XP_016458788.1 PREDICTED: uncharacterized protein LOC107782416 [Nicotiana tabacum]
MVKDENGGCFLKYHLNLDISVFTVIPDTRTFHQQSFFIWTMGRGRGKAKKQSVREDLVSGEEEKMPVRRRGRPQKPKGEIEEEEEVEKVVEDEDDSENTKGSVLNKDIKNLVVEDGKKRKRPSQVMENKDSVEEENGVGTKTNSNDLIKSVGFRQIGSRRKNKPRRAAEVGVECR